MVFRCARFTRESSAKIFYSKQVKNYTQFRRLFKGLLREHSFAKKGITYKPGQSQA